MCKCKYCGKEFDNKQKLGGHTTKCKLNPNYEKNKKQLEEARKNINRENKHLHCQYCNKEIANEGCLKIHETACEKNPNRQKCNNRIGNGGLTKGYSCKWKGKTKYNNEILAKHWMTIEQAYKRAPFF